MFSKLLFPVLSGTEKVLIHARWEMLVKSMKRCVKWTNPWCQFQLSTERGPYSPGLQTAWCSVSRKHQVLERVQRVPQLNQNSLHYGLANSETIPEPDEKSLSSVKKKGWGETLSTVFLSPYCLSQERLSAISGDLSSNVMPLEDIASYVMDFHGQAQLWFTQSTHTGDKWKG